VGALLVFVAGAGLTYFAQLAVARAVGPESFGIFAYVVAWTTLLGYFATLGAHVSLLRLLSAYVERGEWGLARGALRFGRRQVLLIGAATAVTGAVAIIASSRVLSSELALSFLIAFAAIPMIALSLVNSAAVRAFGGVLMAIVPERIVRDGVLIAISLVLVLTVGPDARLAVVALLCGVITVGGLSWYFAQRLRPPALISAPIQLDKVAWRRPAAALTLLMIADNVMSRAGVLALGASGRTREAGIFAVAYSFALLVTLPRMAVATVFAPVVSAKYAKGDKAALQRLSGEATALSLIGTACVVVPLVSLADPLLGLFGREFAASKMLVWLMVAGHAFSAACGPQQHIITMSANEPAGARIFGAAAVLNVIGCAVAIPLLGMAGAAVALTASLVFWNVAMAIFIRQQLGLLPGLFAMRLPRARELSHG